ncbi:MAG: aminoacetone oxidase family FAD-binding enzyme [Bacteroidales bacterium]|nr:aminoacetone oxidase family FAD-binding enzyme [Bacteroidales bacterium]
MEQFSQILVVGAGPAGMMAAIKAAENGAEVAVLEKNHLPGRKLAITGKGRCNITNTKPWSEFSTHVHPRSNFVRSAFYNFSNQATIEYFNNIGLETAVTQGERVFPASMRAFDVVDALADRMKETGVKLIPDADLLAVCNDGDKFKCTYNDLSQPRAITTEVISASALVIATGGLSYPATGSNGRGYEIAASLGHTVTRCYPSLAALLPRNYDSGLYDIELKNVGLKLYVGQDMVQSEMGDLTFTEDGIEGSLGFRVSRKAVHALENGSAVELVIDLKPAISLQELRDRVKREVASFKWEVPLINDARLKKILRKLMPAELIEPFFRMSRGLTVNTLPERLKEWRFPIAKHAGYRRAVVTAGGVSLDEVVAKTMQSRIDKGLFFAGEVLDLDGDTGGYNLQMAFSTGALAGQSAAKYVSTL